ncbi:undecaprenyl-phosphate glucose phosphotransferase [Fluviispira multicolorata]|uniref:Undecaprenyl-phosphate glucose phosphotransferase n=1 Tax=Fluviispira multicolorata TaxID=2654512 RepID=A0A833N5E6_9BACT|nr:undecaprenyl-phosphate glucose phosphotransferase [Fluviispira multicolorata]KAB8030667.1 undecaprenyl-phosphate glucose phosphotransferase [Fluviispira multicolorata]
MYGNILKQNHNSFFLALICSDIILLIIAEFISQYLIFNNFISNHQLFKSVMSSAIFLFPIFSHVGVYTPFRASNYRIIINKLILSFILFFSLFSFAIYLINHGIFYEKVYFLTVFTIVVFILILMSRLIIMFFLRVIRMRGFNTRAIAIVGTGKLAKSIQTQLSDYLWTGYRISAFIDVSEKLKDCAKPTSFIHGIPIYLEAKNLSKWISDKKIEEIWFALPKGDELKIKEMLWELRHKPIPKRYIPEVVSVSSLSPQLGEEGGMFILDIENSKMNGSSVLIKNCVDKILAFIILIFISPILILISIAVKITSDGPVFFKQKRYGIFGNIITVYKFRTMKVHNDKAILKQAQKNDTRLTLIGGFLRRTSLDELPQFVNVLQGRMSIVGPRPHAISHNEYYKDLVNLYMQRHLIKPGITGLAQVNGSRGETDTVEKMQTRVNFDIQYIQSWSVFLDFKIIFLTIFKGFINKNAY